MTSSLSFIEKKNIVRLHNKPSFVDAQGALRGASCNSKSIFKIDVS
jgi:hypothetical protein